MRRLLTLLVLTVVACAPSVPTTPAPPSLPVTTPPAPSPTLAPSASPSRSPEPTEAPPNVCTGRDPAANVYDAGRLVVLSACTTVLGVVAATSHQDDGDMDVQMSLDYGYESMLAFKNVTTLEARLPLRIVCTEPIGAIAAQACAGYRNQLPIPSVGAHIQVTGALVRDRATGVSRIHPVWAISTVPLPPPAPPQAVRDAKAIWSDIRLKWPSIPPAIVQGTELPDGIAAAASLQPDGLARLLVADRSFLDTHNVWHEAGHVLHAAAMRARGHESLLFGPSDDVGISYWTARGFPGTWVAHLQTGSWSTLGYEALAESFATVNLGDAERTETYGVPLDKAAMLAFFKSLSPPAP